MANAEKRRWPRVTLFILVGLVGLFYLGGGWYFSNVIHTDALEPRPATPDYGVYVVAREGGTITLASEEPRQDTVEQGIFGLAHGDGYGLLGEVLSVEGLAVTREYSPVTGGPVAICTASLSTCDPVDIEGSAYQGDPTSVGLAFAEVGFDTPLGPSAGWRVDAGDGSVWAIHVHGWRTERREALRTLPIFHDAGITSLVIDIRNDVGAPEDPTGIYRFGLSEWEDVEAAVRYAVAQGASEIVLVGYSTGASAHMAFLEKSMMRNHVSAVVFDAPNIDMGGTLRHGASQRTIPGTPLPIPSSLVSTAMAIADLRWDVSWSEIDYAKRAGAILVVPTLVFHGTEDDRVPIEASRSLASTVELVELVEVEGAGHVRSWNAGPGEYAAVMGSFLARVAPQA